MNFKKTFFSTVLLSLCLFITEGATRILFHFLSWDIKAYQIDGGRYQVEPFRAYGLTPGWELNHESLKETYNSQGFKSPEFTIKKSDDIYRIVVLGGSSVYGNYGNDKTWSQFLNEYLEQKKDISFNKSFESTSLPVSTYNFFIVPLFSAWIVVSIFIASITNNLSPFVILSLFLINICETCPGRGDPT